MLKALCVRSIGTTAAGAMLAAACSLGAMCASAQTFPTRPVRIIVPFAPGGSTDRNARVLADKLGPRLKQSVIVENRLGGGSLVAIDYVRSQPPDGYAMVVVTVTIATLPSLTPALSLSAQHSSHSFFCLLLPSIFPASCSF